MKDKPLDNKRFSRDVIAVMLLASFVRPPEVVLFFIVIGVSRGWLKTSYIYRITTAKIEKIIFVIFMHFSACSLVSSTGSNI